MEVCWNVACTLGLKDVATKREQERENTDMVISAVLCFQNLLRVLHFYIIELIPYMFSL